MQRSLTQSPKRATPLWVWQIVGVAFLLGLWYLLTSVLKLWPPYVMPTPQLVWEELRYGFVPSENPNDGQLIHAVLGSLRRVLLGYVIAIGIGVVLGVMLSANRTLRDTVGTWLTGIQSIPSIAFVPLAILWFGLNERAVLFVVILEGTLPIALAVSSALLNVNPAVVTAGKNLGAKGLKLYTHVLIPAAIPNLITGLRTAWSFSWRALIGAELLTSNPGLGQVLETGRNISNMALVIATILMVGIVGGIFDQVLRRFENSTRTRYGLEVRQ